MPKAFKDLTYEELIAYLIKNWSLNNNQLVSDCFERVYLMGRQAAENEIKQRLGL